MTLTVETTPARRARLRTAVRLAARAVAPAWPLTTFIAVNPLGGLEDRPFAEALVDAGDLLGARGTLDERAFRAEHARGRITDADLLAAVVRLHPALADAVAEPGPARRLLLADILHGAPAPDPVRRALTPAERRAPDLADTVDAQAAKWCAAFLDEGQAGWPMPGRAQGFYAAWRRLASHDRSLPASARRSLGRVPERPDDAALAALDGLGIDGQEHGTVLQAHLTRLPGWAAHVRWRGEHGAGIDLLAYLAMRLSLEAALLAGVEHSGDGAGRDARPRDDGERGRTSASATERVRRGAEALALVLDAADLEAAAAVLEQLPVPERCLVWLEAYEGHYRDGLLAALTAPAVPAPEGRAAAQVVCCIDVRSEGLRRRLEPLGAYETLGFAGFFAVAIRFRDLAGGAASDQCPVLLEPRHEIVERPVSQDAAAAARELAGRRALAAGADGFHAAKDDLAAPFALAEAAGWVAGPVAAAKTLGAGSYGALRERLGGRAAPSAPTALSTDEAFTAEEQALFAEVALTTMGLTEGFARLVVLCGHGSTTENNPYASALDCGACGGNRGAVNARVAAVIMNAPHVREALAVRGITVPADTCFVAAEHDTASDRVRLLDGHLMPAGHREELDRLVADLDRAGARSSRERCGALPGAPAEPSTRTAARHVRARSTDWAQVFPEWGLARNAAFVVGPRALTRGHDLERRVFLHSYEASVDPGGAALETILTAPLVVAQWISCQYYFSSVDPVVFGAGTKTIHNVVGGIGVLAGHAGDLRSGLPWQSVGVGDRLVHEPMRLLAVVEAPLERIDAIVARNTVLQHLFGNAWVALAAREQAGEQWLRLTPQGWRPWNHETEVAR